MICKYEYRRILVIHVCAKGGRILNEIGRKGKKRNKMEEWSDWIYWMTVSKAANFKIPQTMKWFNDLKFDLVTLDTKPCRKKDVTSDIY